MGCSKSSPKREVPRNKCLLKKQENSQINKLTLLLKELEKEGQMKPRVSRKKEITKIREEINEIEIKKTVEKIDETKN